MCVGGREKKREKKREREEKREGVNNRVSMAERNKEKE